MAAEVLFVRVAAHAYMMGIPNGESFLHEPRVRERLAFAIAYAVLAERGQRIDITRLMPPHQIDDRGEEIARKNPRVCASNCLLVARKAIGDLSPALRTVLDSVEFDTERINGELRVFAKVPLNRSGVVVRT